ncbi:MAG: hypothetical protein BYD32DRAFT_98810 [Podila humilis]|nr:MAG: hypothetical protein BYD32DRAFT_98810 [Podila humilis]
MTSQCRWSAHIASRRGQGGHRARRLTHRLTAALALSCPTTFHVSRNRRRQQTNHLDLLKSRLITMVGHHTIQIPSRNHTLRTHGSHGCARTMAPLLGYIRQSSQSLGTTLRYRPRLLASFPIVATCWEARKSPYLAQGSEITSVGFHPKMTSSSSGRATPGAQFSYADKTGLVLAELVAEILVMGRDDYDEPQTRSGLGLLNYDLGDRAEQRLGGLGDMRSRATRVVRRGSMRRDSSDVSKSSYGGSRLNPMSESPRRMSSHSPTMEHHLDDDELERLVTDMMSLSVTQSIVPTPQTCRALEDAILKTVAMADDIQHISLQNDQRHTILHLAVLLEMDRLVEYLLKERIEINAADWNGFTALHYAAWTGQRGTYENLENHGASSEIQNCHQAVPRHLFAEQPGVPADFRSMYHARQSMDGIQSSKPSSRDSYLNNSNLKDDIHEAYIVPFEWTCTDVAYAFAHVRPSTICLFARLLRSFAVSSTPRSFARRASQSTFG